MYFMVFSSLKPVPGVAGAPGPAGIQLHRQPARLVPAALQPLRDQHLLPGQVPEPPAVRDLPDVDLLHRAGGPANSRNPRHLDTIEGRRVYQALHIESKSFLDTLRRVKKCLRHST